MTVRVLNKSFTGTGTSDSFSFQGTTNVLIVGGAGIVSVEKTFDGTTYYIVSRDNAGTDATFTTVGGSVAFNGVMNEIERDGLLYRFNCTTHTSGTIICRMSA